MRRLLFGLDELLININYYNTLVYYMNPSISVISKRIVLLGVLLLGVVTSAFPQSQYEVTVKLANVRSGPTTKSTILGTLSKGQIVDVLNDSGSWAQISYKNRKAYVAFSLLKKIEVPEVVNDSVIELQSPVSAKETKTNHEDTIGPRSIAEWKKKIHVDFVPGIKLGMTTFATTGYFPIPTCGFGVDLGVQCLLVNKLSIIPENFFVESSIGYSMKGSSAYPMHYIEFMLIPLGYRWDINDLILLNQNEPLYFVGKGGIFIGHSFSDISTTRYTFYPNCDVGIVLNVGVEWHKIRAGLSYERSFTNAVSSNLKLKNQCLFINFSYRLCKLL